MGRTTPKRQLFGGTRTLTLQQDVFHTEALFDKTGVYRYRLVRTWNATAPKALFIMLNPSMADEHVDDPTIRRAQYFARRLGCGSLVAMNLFALRSTDPKNLRIVEDPVGPENDSHLVKACEECSVIVFAWGCHGEVLGRAEVVASRIQTALGDYHARSKVLCFGRTLGGHPKHPLYLPNHQTLLPYFSS